MAIALVTSNDMDGLKDLTLKQVSIQDEEGLTPLHWAARKGYVGIVQHLLALGVDSGSTPLYEAALQKHYPVVTILLESSASVNLQDAHGRSVLHIASENGDEKTALLCLRHGKDVKVNIKDMFDRVALHWACRQGFEELVDEFIKRGADINSKSQAGDTPLHWASLNGHTKVCKMLLSAGADATITNTKGESVSEVATNPQLRQMLEEATTQQIMEKSKEPEPQETPQTTVNTATVAQPISTAVKMVAKPPPKKLKITLKK